LETSSTYRASEHPEESEVSSSNEKSGPIERAPPITEKVEDPQEEARSDNPPDGADGDETVEWKEGKDIVVEHHAPGEEVEVEVLRDEDTDGDLQKAAPTKSKIQESKKQTKNLVSTTESPSRDTPNMTTGGALAHNQSSKKPSDEDSESEWRDIEEVDDDDDDDDDITLPTRNITRPQPAARQVKRRRDSMRKSIFSKNIRPRATRAQNHPEELADIRRSRPPAIKTELAQGSIPSRESSPARSVHWEDRSHPRADRSSAIPNNEVTPKVQFELPP